MFLGHNLKGKVSIVTGAGRGIGRGIAIALAEAGSDLAAVARTEDQLEDCSKEVRRLGVRCISIPTDVTVQDQVERMVQIVLSELHRIDILVNNAGAMVPKPFAPMPEATSHLAEIIPNFRAGTSEAEWKSHININATSVFLCTSAVAKTMIAQRSGKIINIASIDVVKSSPYHSAYTASKAAVVGLTKALALEWARYNININAVSPGYFPTSMSEFGFKDERIREGMLKIIPLRRFGDVKDVAALVAFLATSAADYITGQVIYVDGGLSIG